MRLAGGQGEAAAIDSIQTIVNPIQNDSFSIISVSISIERVDWLVSCRRKSLIDDNQLRWKPNAQVNDSARLTLSLWLVTTS